jgi:hypothetical protein
MITGSIHRDKVASVIYFHGSDALGDLPLSGAKSASYGASITPGTMSKDH